jgi:endonuclease I
MGKCGDMYSDNPSGYSPYEYTFGSDQCGSYYGEGSCYNREHSFPQAWWGGSTDTMTSDLFHIFPTDGYVNGQRDSYPFGEVGSASWTSQNGSKRGTSSVAGYSGTVFEPIDDYKGDFARAQLYMAVRYKNKISIWNSYASYVLDGTSYPAFDSWYITMLLQWHADDPVSQKEIDRNDDVYNIQGNRNPFVDHPEYANQIWSAYAPLKPEPSNHVADFRGRHITLQWTDATGSILPDGYLVRMSSVGFSSIANPVDGTPVSDSSTDKNIVYGQESCSFSSLQGNTTYYFKIFSYKGSGASIDYKTDGSIPQTSKKTN